MVTPEVKGNNAEVTVETFVKNADGAEITYKILDGEALVAETTSADTKVNLTIENVHLWNGKKDPYLYTAEIEIVDGENVIDNIEKNADENGYFNSYFLLEENRHLNITITC